MNARLIVRGTGAKFILLNCLILLPGTYMVSGALVQAVRGRLTLGTLFGIGVGAWMVFYAISLVVGSRIVLTENEISVSSYRHVGNPEPQLTRTPFMRS
jgi:hypothetical protein